MLGNCDCFAWLGMALALCRTFSLDLANHNDLLEVLVEVSSILSADMISPILTLTKC